MTTPRRRSGPSGPTQPEAARANGQVLLRLSADERAALDALAARYELVRSRVVGVAARALEDGLDPHAALRRAASGLDLRGVPHEGHPDSGTCPWYLSAAAVRAWQRVEPRAPRDFDAASDALLELAARVWATYRKSAREPRLLPSGDRREYCAGRADGRVRLIVALGTRPEGPAQQVVDVVPRSTAAQNRRQT